MLHFSEFPYFVIITSTTNNRNYRIKPFNNCTYNVRKNWSEKVIIFRRQRIYNIIIVCICEYQACLKQTDELSVISVFTMAYKPRGRESGMSGKIEVSNWASHCECWRKNVVCDPYFGVTNSQNVCIYKTHI